jgi:hypothetical protein
MAQSVQIDPVEKKIRLIRYWTFGVFVLAFVLETLVPGLFARWCVNCSFGQVFGLLVANAWPMWLITLIVCGVVFFGYPLWAQRTSK